MATLQICPCCGETFTAYSSARRIFCSMSCKAANGRVKAEPIVLEASRIAYCNGCGKTFRPTQGAPSGYCGVKCRQAARRDVSRRYAASVEYVGKDYPEKPCRHCGETFKPWRINQFNCSDLCKQLAQNARQRYGAGPRSCRYCGAECPRRAGHPVCDGCKKDPRHRPEHEQKRKLRKYGVTQQWYDATLEAQESLCPICGTDNPGKNGWAIDHCHTTGKVRSLLCGSCNSALGLLKENIDVMRRAIEYLERHDRGT